MHAQDARLRRENGRRAIFFRDRQGTFCKHVLRTVLIRTIYTKVLIMYTVGLRTWYPFVEVKKFFALLEGTVTWETNIRMYSS